MRIFLVFVSIMLLGAEILCAQDTSFTMTESLAKEILPPAWCMEGNKTQKVAVDDKGKPKGPWLLDTSDGKGVLAKLISGDKNYLRAFNQLRGTIRYEPAVDTVDKYSPAKKHIKASLSEELPYRFLGLTYFKLKILKLTLDQHFSGSPKFEYGEWLPDHLDLEIEYWRVSHPNSMVHDKYEVSVGCDIGYADF